MNIHCSRYNSSEVLLNRFVGTDNWILARLGEYTNSEGEVFMDDFSSDCWIKLLYCYLGKYTFCAIFDNREVKSVPCIKLRTDAEIEEAISFFTEDTLTANTVDIEISQPIEVYSEDEFFGVV